MEFVQPYPCLGYSVDVLKMQNGNTCENQLEITCGISGRYLF